MGPFACRLHRNPGQCWEDADSGLQICQSVFEDICLAISDIVTDKGQSITSLPGLVHASLQLFCKDISPHYDADMRGLEMFKYWEGTRLDSELVSAVIEQVPQSPWASVSLPEQRQQGKVLWSRPCLCP